MRMAMLWALVSSAYVIYLYRKLNAGDEPQPPDASDAMSAVDAELVTLTEKIGQLESRLSKG